MDSIALNHQFSKDISFSLQIQDPKMSFTLAAYFHFIEIISDLKLGLI